MRGLSGLKLGAGDREIGFALIEALVTDRARFCQRLGAPDIGRVEFELRFGARDIRLGAFHGEFIGALIQREEQVALLHQLAVLEMDLLDETGDARAHFGRVDGFEAAGIFVPGSDALGDRLCHGHRNGLRLLRRGGQQRARTEPATPAAKGGVSCSHDLFSPVAVAINTMPRSQHMGAPNGAQQAMTA